MNAVANKKLKHLLEIRKKIHGCQLGAATKKLLRYQSLFKFKARDEDSALFYSALLQMGSYKLLDRLILPNFDLSILERDEVNPETVIKLSILARVLANQGAYLTSLYILEKIKKSHVEFPTTHEKTIFLKSLYYVYLFNQKTDDCVDVLEEYISIGEKDNDQLFFYYSSHITIELIKKNTEAAKRHWEKLSFLTTGQGIRFNDEYTRFFSFAIRAFEGQGDERGFQQANTLFEYLVGESEKLFIRIVQLKYLFSTGDQIRILRHIESIYKLKASDGSACPYLREILKEEFNKRSYVELEVNNFQLRYDILRFSHSENSAVVWNEIGLHTQEYFQIPMVPNQLDLRAGVVKTQDSVFVLTELQRKCLYFIFTSGESGVKWIRLAELIYGVNLNLDAVFESLRKQVSKLRSMGMDIYYKSERYYFKNTFNSIIFALEFLPGFQLLFLARRFGKDSFSSEDVSKILGFKKSRTSVYLHMWLDQKSIILLETKGKQKRYLINYDILKPLKYSIGTEN